MSENYNNAALWVTTELLSYHEIVHMYITQLHHG